MPERKSREDVKNEYAKRLQENQDRSESGGGSYFRRDLPQDVKFWTPSEAYHTIDILPYAVGNSHPYLPEGTETYVHEFHTHKRGIGIGEGTIMCLAETYKTPCPICEDRRRQIKEGADEKSVKILRPAQHPRSIYNILCLDTTDEEAKGVQIFSTSHFLMEMFLLELAKKPVRPGEKAIDPLVIFFDPKEGKSVNFKREGKAELTKFLYHRFIDRPKDFVIDQRDLEDCWTLDDLIWKPTYEEVQVYYWGRGQHQPAEASLGTGVEAGRSRKGRYEAADVKDDVLKKDKDEVETGANPCPHGHVFSKDIDKFPKDCDKCEKWKACARSGREDKEKPDAKEDADKGAAAETGKRSRRTAAEPEKKEEAAPTRRSRRT